MQLRHIRPRSSEWYDALENELDRMDRLSPEETSRLRAVLEAEQIAFAVNASGEPTRLGPQHAPR